MAEKITVSTQMGELFSSREFLPWQKYLMYQGASPERHSEESSQFASAPLSSLSQIGWSPEGIAAGLNFFLEALEEGRVSQYFVYTEDQTADDPQKKDVNLIRILPENKDREKPWILLAAGGAYMSVCTMVESLPTARHMVQAGYEVYLLTYRVGEVGDTPKALDDLAAALKWIGENRTTLGIDPSRYAVGGFSAGANLISSFGAPNIGYPVYGLPKPLAMFPVYTFIDLKAESHRDEKGGLLVPMLGENYRDILDCWNIADHVDGDYPPCYIVCGKDDNTVPPRNSELLKELLDRAGVPAVLEEGDHAPHGFGDGTGTDVEGWPERALAFLESLS